MSTIIKNIANNIYQAADGIWYANNKSPISYPDDGNHTLNILQQNSFWFNHRNLVIEQVMKNYAPSFPFFDIGGGTGFVSKHIQDHLGECILVEPQLDGYMQAQKFGIQNIIAATTLDAQFNENVLPSAGMFDVVEHIEQDYEFMKNIHQYLVQGGKVFITVPALPYLWSDEDVDAGHYRRYTTASMTELLEKSGFEIEYVSYFFSFLVVPLFLFRSLPTKLGIKRAVSDLDKLKKEHTQRQGIGNRFLQILMKRELKSISDGKRLSAGTSVIAVARKI